MKTVGILGGSFNPPHIGHARVAEEVLESGWVDEVWIMPCKHNPLKVHQSNSFKQPTSQQRYDMVELMVGELSGGIYLSNFELIHNEGGESSYTYKTLQKLSNHYPDHTFKWIVGMDQVESHGLILKGWMNGEEIKKEYGIILLSRGGYSTPVINSTIDTNEVVVIESDTDIELSSTVLRMKIMNGKSTKYLIPDSVREYIDENQLYQRYKSLL